MDLYFATIDTYDWIIELTHGLTNFVSQAEINDSVRPLPLLHTTSVFSFRSILENMILSPAIDSVFGEELLYFFYGKPSYFPKTKLASDLLFNAQVFFILKPESLSGARRVFPFDTGAFDAGIYSRFMNNNMKLLDFQVDLDTKNSGGTPFPLSAQKIVSALYGTNERYYRSEQRDDLLPLFLDFETQAFVELLKSKAGDVFDDRRGVIEIQSTRALPLNSETLEGIIVPIELLDSDEFVSFATACGLQGDSIMTYNSNHSRPEYFAAFATERVATFLANNNYF